MALVLLPRNIYLSASPDAFRDRSEPLPPFSWTGQDTDDAAVIERIP